VDAHARVDVVDVEEMRAHRLSDGAEELYRTESVYQLVLAAQLMIQTRLTERLKLTYSTNQVENSDIDSLIMGSLKVSLRFLVVSGN